MKRLWILPAVLSLALFASCQKQQTEEERRAEVERQVQERLAAEHTAQQQQQLDQRQAELDARERALATSQSATATPETTLGLTTADETTTSTTSRKRESSRGKRSTASYGIFYRKLEPYGSWFETNNYGYVWQPRDAEQSRSWRPYTDGHWVYTDAGWTWVSDDPYGWATYHYGRWTRLRNIGWVWVPGDEWAPAWVSWRESDQYVGWAPLPPEAQFDRTHGIHNWADNYYDISPDQYVFVPTSEVGVQRIARAAVPPQQNVTIINETTNVTNITYNNTMIVNQGPSYDQLRSRSQQPIERYRLERETTSTADRPVVRGEVIAMPDPMAAVPAEPVYQQPPTVKERIANAVVENGWNMIADRAAAEQARKKMKSEATPPADAPSKTYVKPEPIAAGAATTTASPAESRSAAPTATVATATAESPTATPRTAATFTPASATKPSPTATATASPRVRHTPSPFPTPSATATATATPIITPRPRQTPSPSATPASSVAAEATATPMTTARPRHTPFAAPSPTAAERASATPPAASAAPTATSPAELGFTARDAKLREQEMKQRFEAARHDRQHQEEESKAAEELKRDAFRRQKQRDSLSLTPNPVSTPAPAASTRPSASASATTPRTTATPAVTATARIGGGPAKEQPPKNRRAGLPSDLGPHASPTATPQPTTSPATADQ